MKTLRQLKVEIYIKGSVIFYWEGGAFENFSSFVNF